MEDQRATDHRWPRVPERLLVEAEKIIEASDGIDGFRLAFCGVPIQQLTEREARAALAYLMQRRFKSIRP